MRVFIMEPSVTRTETYMRALGGFGHTVCVCQSVSEGIRRYPLANEPYELLLLAHRFNVDPRLDADPSILTGEDFCGVISKPKEARAPLAIVVDRERDGTFKMVRTLADKGFQVSWIPYGVGLALALEKIASDKAVRH